MVHILLCPSSNVVQCRPGEAPPPLSRLVIAAVVTVLLRGVYVIFSVIAVQPAQYSTTHRVTRTAVVVVTVTALQDQIQ